MNDLDVWVLVFFVLSQLSLVAFAYIKARVEVSRGEDYLDDPIMKEALVDAFREKYGVKGEKE